MNKITHKKIIENLKKHIEKREKERLEEGEDRKMKEKVMPLPRLELTTSCYQSCALPITPRRTSVEKRSE